MSPPLNEERLTAFVKPKAQIKIHNKISTGEWWKFYNMYILVPCYWDIVFINQVARMNAIYLK